MTVVAEQANVADLDEIVQRLEPDHLAAFERIFRVSVAQGELIAPAEMHAWIARLFGSVDATRRQKIVRVTNLVTLEGALFNELRSRRPIDMKETLSLMEEIENHQGDPFCKPDTGTPADVFGRVRGRHCITASNVAKYDTFSGLVIFNEHNPLSFTSEAVHDYIDTALEWGRRAHQSDPLAKYLFIMWNCLWKSGATLVHGHFQMTLTRDMHYPKVESLRRAALAYRESSGRDYFDDLYQAHRSVGCAFEKSGTRIIASLAPVKEKEVLLISYSLDEELKEAIFKTAEAMTKAMGVASFNLVLYMPPIGPVQEDWSGFPYMARMVDRGDPSSRNCDMGAMELYATSVVSSDPLGVARILRERMGGQ
ncbi:MAG: hypothetical protein Q8R28_03515 [Dehalococcoidia bacterium]|nr:hypothetical protein [Dehalococcoidia bacterium]